MESRKGHREEEEDNDAAATNNNIKAGKNSERANAMRSKHSVTEQRRRSKINERFQMLRKLIPHSDQKRDTASFLLEVIQYVQFLQEQVQKYEGSHQSCSSEPTKLMPWRNSHWNIQGTASQPNNAMNDPCPRSTFPGRENPIESDAIRDASHRSIDPTTEVSNKPMSLPVSISHDRAFSDPLQRPSSDVQSTKCPVSSDCLTGHDELAVEGGTISISSAYSDRLLSSLTQALRTTGLDLSQGSISVKINLGKQANRQPTLETSTAEDHDMPMLAENSDRSQKRLKILQNG